MSTFISIKNPPIKKRIIRTNFRIKTKARIVYWKRALYKSSIDQAGSKV